MTDALFNVQTIDRETGDERWVTVRASDAESARQAAASDTAVVGEVRPADPRVGEAAAIDDEFDAIPLEPSGEPFQNKVCGVCGRPMNQDSPVCAVCGNDERRSFEGARRARYVVEDGRSLVRCGECGYDLTGLRPSPVCPECGTASLIPPRPLPGACEESARTMYRRPAIVLGIGLIGTLAIAGSVWKVTGLLVSLQMLFFLFPIAFLAASGCLLLWIGVDSYWRLLALQISAASAVFALTATIVFVPFTNIVLSAVLGFFALCAALTVLLGLDLVDGVLMAVAIFAVYVFSMGYIYI